MRGFLFHGPQILVALVGFAALDASAGEIIAPAPPIPAVRRADPGAESPSQGMRSGSMVHSSAARLARAMNASPPPSPILAPPIPGATDDIALAVGKTLLDEDPSTHERVYRIDLSWSGGQAPYKVSTSLLPSFEGNNRTLALNLDAALFSAMADPMALLECYSISDDTFVSDSVQGIGYDPYPAPELPALAQNEKWWGDTVTVRSGYLDPIAPGNLFGMDALKVKADSVTVGADGFGAEATFTIPEDARGTYAILEAHGLSSPAGYPLVLSPRGIGPFAQVRGVTYAPQTGHLWVAADDVIQEIDVFKHDPEVVRTLSGYTKPYISRVTVNGNLLFVEGITGASMVHKVSVTSGAVSNFRAVNDGGFSRQVTPVGIAAAADESVCFIADKISPTGWQDRVVKIPQSTGSPINGYWGNVFHFQDPCAMDVGADNLVYLSGNFLGGWYVVYIKPTTDWPDGLPWEAIHTEPDICKSIEMDRDMSTATPVKNRFYWSTDPGMAHGYNQNEIADSAGPFPARYLGAEIYAVPSAQTRSGMTLSVEFMHSYSGPDGGPHISKRVILNNAGQTAPYVTRDQVADRIVKFQVRGFQGTYLLLRLIDPKDGAPYAPLDGWPPTDPTGHPAVSPYEARDNRVWGLFGYEDFGMSLNPDGGIQKELSAMILNNPNHPNIDYRDVYLKLPERFSGDNWQVEIRRMSPTTWTAIPNQVPTFTDVFTGWKRVFVERDRMFRRGGLLYAPDEANMTIPSGLSSLPIFKGPAGAQLDNLNPGDKIAIFDTSKPFEGVREEAFVGSIDRVSNPDYALVHMVTQRGGMDAYPTQRSYTASPNDLASHYPDFSKGKSAGIGVVNSNDGSIADTSENQVNGPGSAFYDADMRQIEQPYNEAFIQFLAPDRGRGALPYLPPSMLSLSDYTGDCNHMPTVMARYFVLARYGWIWFVNKTTTTALPNYLHLIGSECPPAIYACGRYEYTGTTPFNTEDSPPNVTRLSLISPCVPEHTTPAYSVKVTQDASCHEPAHHFLINQCLVTDSGHDHDNAWCGMCGGNAVEKCLMNEDFTPPRDATNDIIRFGLTDIVGPQSACPTNLEPALRTHTDPIP